MTAMNTTPSASRMSNARIAFLLILGTESIFFATVLVAYIALRAQIAWNIPHTLARLTVPLVNTCLLLASTGVAWWANRSIQNGSQSRLKEGLFITLLMGLVFVAGQIYEFNHAGLRINDPSFGGVFFTLLGFHAAHVLAGVVFLTLNLIRTNLGDFTAEQYETVQLGTWFWYYVAAVWIVLFIALYLV